MRQRGYPLSLLFIVTTLFAVLAAVTATGVRGAAGLGLPWRIGSILLSSICGFVMGGIVGLYHVSPARGFALGATAGLVVGAIMGPTLLVQPAAFGGLLFLQVVGAIVVVVLAALFCARFGTQLGEPAAADAADPTLGDGNSFTAQRANESNQTEKPH